MKDDCCRFPKYYPAIIKLLAWPSCLFDLFVVWVDEWTQPVKFISSSFVTAIIRHNGQKLARGLKCGYAELIRFLYYLLR